MSERKLNIAFVTDMFYPYVSGVVTYLNIIIGKLVKEGHKVTVYTNKTAINLFSKENVKVVNLPSIESPTYPGMQICFPNAFKLRRSIIAQNPDIVHLHTHPSPLTITVMIIAKQRKIPVVATFHGFLDKYECYISLFRAIEKIKITFGRKFLRLLKEKIYVKLNNVRAGRLWSFEITKKRVIWRALRKTYNWCDVVAVPSRLSAEKVASHGILCITLPYGVDAENFRVKKSYARTGRILSVCRLGYEKNLDVLIRAFSLLLKKHPKARLTLVGDGPARSSLVELAGNLELQGSVSFEGAVERSRLQKYFDTHDFFANASDSETFGYVTAEAMAAGLPVVAVDAQGSKDLVRDSINGFLVKPNRIVEFARAMERMMDKKADLRAMGATSRRLVLNFSVENCYDKHIRVYSELAESGIYPREKRFKSF